MKTVTENWGWCLCVSYLWTSSLTHCLRFLKPCLHCMLDYTLLNLGTEINRSSCFCRVFITALRKWIHIDDPNPLLPDPLSQQSMCSSVKSHFPASARGGQMNWFLGTEEWKSLGSFRKTFAYKKVAEVLDFFPYTSAQCFIYHDPA